MKERTEVQEKIQLNAQRHVRSSGNQMMLILPPTARSERFQQRSVLTVQETVAILTVTGTAGRAEPVRILTVTMAVSSLINANSGRAEPMTTRQKLRMTKQAAVNILAGM